MCVYRITLWSVKWLHAMRESSVRTKVNYPFVQLVRCPIRSLWGSVPLQFLTSWLVVPPPPLPPVSVVGPSDCGVCHFHDTHV